jgi:signal transduction histidine kinase
MKLFGEKYLKGKVWFESNPATGTTFFILLPKEKI